MTMKLTYFLLQISNIRNSLMKQSGKKYRIEKKIGQNHITGIEKRRHILKGWMTILSFLSLMKMRWLSVNGDQKKREKQVTKVTGSPPKESGRRRREAKMGESIHGGMILVSQN